MSAQKFPDDGEKPEISAAPGAPAAAGEPVRKDGKPTRAQRAREKAELARRVQLQTLQEERDSERQLAEQLRNKVGRPSEYTEERAGEICQWIVNGKSLVSYCRQHAMGIETVYRWLRTHAEFRDRYAQAHEDRADTLADQMLDIADTRGMSMEDAQMAKLAVETRKWIASKLRPQKYGERQETVVSGGVNIRIGIPQRPIQAVETVDNLDTTPRGDVTPRRH